MLNIRNLSLDYGGKAGKAVREATLSISGNCITGIVGESGSGKTTLAHAILGILPPYAKISGEIWFQKKNLVSATEAQMKELRGRKMAMVFQSAQNALHPCYRVLDQAAEIIAYKRPCSPAEARSLFLKHAKDFGLSPDDMRHFPHQLSGGMKQRAYIALILALSPSLLIADEPTTALDVLVQAHVLQGLERAQRELHLAILFISHDLITVLAFADEVIIFYGGRVMEKGSAQQMREEPLHPYTQHLLDSTSLKTTAKENAPAAKKGCPFTPSCPLRQAVCERECPTLEQKQGREVACHALANG